MLELSTRAETAKTSQLHIIEGICDGRLPDIKPTARRKLLPFVKIICTLRELAEKVTHYPKTLVVVITHLRRQGTSPPDLIRRLVELLEYQDYLRRTQPDWESRWENVQELITFASEVWGGSVDEVGSEETRKEDELKSVSHSIIVKASQSCINRETPLRLFLQASMLSSEGDSQSEDNSTEVFPSITSLP